MIRIGMGYDVHPLVSGCPLVLGGVTIPFEKGLQGHSDADALLHAVSDALLGALALGDLGKHFPDNDPRYKGIESLKLLGEVFKKISNQGYRVNNVDSVIIAERPRLSSFLPAMAENIARVLKIEAGQVSVKATREEGLGFTGRGEGVAAKAVVLVEKGGSVP
jgi:2-C-methyl-D-erythritol 2,4-cyclodiphosphate synthase